MTDDEIRAGNRPSPEALLDSARRESRGRLKIFLGAAPGVGKTYEMLTAARTRKAEGVDVVIGVVETHGRKETEALLVGFEATPRVQVPYKGHMLEEMALDAILARKPALVLVDELAHTNAPGSRHPKRYLDVEEILEHGIDVYTTLNIQHVESLNDVVAQITRIRVRETVPDSIIDRADDIEIIDLTPDDLIKRLRDGKVYLPNMASRAIENYFSPGNLTALRELALRRTAQRVDDQLLNHMQSRAIPGPWAAGERVLVCVDEQTRGPSLVRYAKRQADRMRAPWAALFIETPRAANRPEADKDRVAATLRLAERLGGDAITLPGQTVARDILRYAIARNYTHIIVGRPGKARWLEWIEGSVSRDLIRVAGDISVHVVSGQEAGAPTVRGVATATESRFAFRPYLLSLIYLGAATLAGALLSRALDVQNVALVFLMAVLGSAISGGLGPALFASMAGALAFNFFFLPPLYTLDIGSFESFVAFLFFIGVAVVTSNLAARVQRQAAAARDRARTTEDLYLFSRKLAGAATLDEVMWATAFQMASMLRARVVILLPDGDTLAVRAGYPPDDTLADSDIAAARWAWEHDRPAGRGADTLPGAKRLYLPLRTGRAAIGVVGLDNDRPGPLLSPERQRLFDALADQAALALERIQLVADVDRARLAAEADKLRAALLRSISHDLRTPLAAILGAGGALRDYSTALPEADRMDLLATIVDEAERLNRFIANLLDMTRIEAGAIEPNLSMQFVGDVVETALRRAATVLAGRRTEVEIPADLPMVRLDPVLFEQALFNIFDNAAKFAPPKSTIRVSGRADDGSVVIVIADEGPGIPVDSLEKVFDSFYRVGKTDSVRAGTGLGLSICRSFIEAMGGTVTASNRTDRSGAVFSIRMPASGEATTLPRTND